MAMKVDNPYLVETKMKKPSSCKIDVYRIANLLGIDTLSDFDDKVIMFDSGTYGYAYKQALEDGKTEEEAEEAAQEAEQEENAEIWRKYYDAVMSAAETYFGHHELELVPVKVSRTGLDSNRPLEYRIVPKTTWFSACSQIKQTLNGYGMFYAGSVSELCNSVPCTVRECVLTHLHWMKHYGEVYGDYSPRAIVERHLRY